VVIEQGTEWEIFSNCFVVVETDRGQGQRENKSTKHAQPQKQTTQICSVEFAASCCVLLLLL
jgi:hypothetical protein